MIDPSTSMKALLIDDDPVLLGLLSFKLKRLCPDITISQLTTPEALSGFDIYVIDNDFGGAHSGARLAERIRTVAPEALILVFSSFLDVPLLKRVANIGADGVFDKREETDIEALLELVAAHVARASVSAPAKRSILGDLAAMLGAWNARLAREESSRAPS